MAPGSSPPGNMMQGRMAGPQNSMMSGMQATPQGGAVYPSGDMKGWPQGNMPRSRSVAPGSLRAGPKPCVVLSYRFSMVKYGCVCGLQLVLPGTVPSAGQPKPVWKHDDEQLHRRPWSRSRTNGPDARTETGPDGHEPYGNGKDADGSRPGERRGLTRPDKTRRPGEKDELPV